MSPISESLNVISKKLQLIFLLFTCLHNIFIVAKVVSYQAAKI